MNPRAAHSHVSDDELIARLYGLDAGRDAHLESCAECAARWEQVQDRRASAIAPASVSSAVLGAQRERVLGRLAAPASPLRRLWVPALAAAVLIAAGLALYSPVEPPAPPLEPVAADAVEADWYEDAYSAQPVEPRAASPLRALFEEEVATE